MSLSVPTASKYENYVMFHSEFNNKQEVYHSFQKINKLFLISLHS